MKLMKKYITGVLLLGAVAFGFTSCNLDEYNPSGEDADAVFSTPEGMEALVNQMYYNFRWKYYGREDPVLYMEGSGDIWQNSPNNYGYGKQLTRYIDLQGDRGQIANAWNRVYDNINVCNTVINRLDQCEGLSESQYNAFNGEARFMRSYCYWWLVEFFGDIEMRVKETQTPEFTAVRTDRKVIYDEVIIPDAEQAIASLTVNPMNGDIGRSTKKAAYGLLARVCLARAQYEEAGSEAQKAFYQKALDAANYVINNKGNLGISLYGTYDEIWQAKNNKNNTEFLWVVTHSSNSSLNPQASNPNRLHCYFSPSLVDNAGIINSANTYEYPKENQLLMPTYYFLKLWQPWDKRYKVLFQEEFPENAARGTYKWSQVMVDRYYLENDHGLLNKSVKAGNTALKFTKESVTDAEKDAAAVKGYAIVGIDDVFDTQNVNAKGGCKVKDPATDPTTTQFIAKSFPRFMKYRVWDRDPNGTILLQGANTRVCYADVPVMRYAEMPLIAAECYIGLGDKASAANIINKEIRNQRVVADGYKLSDVQVAAGDMTVEWILEERARELCGEFLRWFDLKRTGKLVEYVRGHNPSMTGDDCIAEHNNLWPIPNTFLDKLQNAEEFGQNPGYNPYVRQ